MTRQAPISSTSYKYYVLAVLTAMMILTGVERAGTGLMLQDIKQEFVLTDTQLGLLGGIAFAVFYAFMGIPIARWADRGNRVSILSLTMLLLSVGVALCSAVGSFVQLLLARVGVAVGETGCVPLSYSLIPDYFSRAERPRASALYGGIGSAATSVLGYFGVGWLIELYGWRQTYVLLAIPGLALAALARFTLREPRSKAAPAAQPSLREVGAKLWASRCFRHLLMCQAVMIFFNIGVGQWLAMYFMRSFGLSTGQVGTGFALVFGVGGMLGAYMGGELASRHAAGNERLQLQGTAWAIVVCSLFATAIYLAPNAYWAFGFSGLMMIGLTAIIGPMYSTMQTLLPGNMRAVSFALANLVANLLGMGLGPLAAGALSDTLRPWAGEESVRYALLLLSPGYCWAAWHAWRASRTVTGELAEASRESVGEPVSLGKALPLGKSS